MQRSNLAIIILLVVIVVLLLVILAVLLMPALGGGWGHMRGFGPMRGWDRSQSMMPGTGFGPGMGGGPGMGPGSGPMPGMGRMSFGMMRQVHEMGNVNSEYEYLVKMIPHHQEAVDNAELLAERTNRREMRRVASQIIESQSREIQEMERWRDRWAE